MGGYKLLSGLFGLLAGGAMIAKDSIDAARENVRSMEIAEARKEYVKAHTDSELEERLMHDVENPEKYEDLWERIESFKRDNPVFCSKHASRYERFGWNNVGHERLMFRSAKGGLYGKTQYESMLLDGNRNIAVYLLMQTYGKMKKSHAQAEAERIYPIIPSKRRW